MTRTAGRLIVNCHEGPDKRHRLGRRFSLSLHLSGAHPDDSIGLGMGHNGLEFVNPRSYTDIG